jgi:gluconolactonase
MMRWDEATGRTSVFAIRRTIPTATPATARAASSPAKRAARHLTEYDGTITVRSTSSTARRSTAERCRRQVRRRDLVRSDPGHSGNYEGHVAPQELPTNVSARSSYRRATVVVGDIRPNRLCLRLTSGRCIVDFSATPPDRVYDVVDAAPARHVALRDLRSHETPDGFRCDIDGNLWCGWGTAPALDGVMVFNPDGKRIVARSRCPAQRQPLLRRSGASACSGEPLGCIRSM